jgi:hypothetical protein
LTARNVQHREIHLHHVVQHNERSGTSSRVRSPLVYPGYPKADPRLIDPAPRTNRRFGFE